MRRVLQPKSVTSLLARCHTAATTTATTTTLTTTTSTTTQNNPTNAISHRSFIQQRAYIRTTFVNNYHTQARSIVAGIDPLKPDLLRPHGSADTVRVSDTAAGLMSGPTRKSFASVTGGEGEHGKDKLAGSKIGSEGDHDKSSDLLASTSAPVEKKKRAKRFVSIEKQHNTRSSKGKSASKVGKLEQEFVLDRRLRGGATASTGSSSSAGGGSKKHQTNVKATIVEHDTQLKRFTLDLGNNQKARIDYRILHKGTPNQAHPMVIELHHSEVPKELRGRGIGKALASGALDCIESNKWRVVITCSYLDRYMKEHAKGEHKRLYYQR